jgi:hypothetical protein
MPSPNPCAAITFCTGLGKRMLKRTRAFKILFRNGCYMLMIPKTLETQSKFPKLERRCKRSSFSIPRHRFRWKYSIIQRTLCPCKQHRKLSKNFYQIFFCQFETLAKPLTNKCISLVWWKYSKGL